MPPPLRYVVLWHDGVRDPHFDVMVETYPGSPLSTWRVPRWPVNGPVPAVRLPDHRRAYLEYEGDLSAGRGRVTRAVAGTCDVVVGEGAVWTVTFRGGVAPHALTLRPLDVDRWEVAPS